MSETPAETTEPADPPELEQRVDRVESKLDRLIEIVSGGERKAQGTAQAGREAELDAPTSVGEQIRAQLEERDAKAAAAAGKQADADRIGAIETRLAEMSEQRPQTPVRRIERVMWGNR